MHPAESDCQQIDSFDVQQSSPMKKWLIRLTIAGVLGLALALPIAVRADNDDDGDHDRARELYEQGEIHALYDILAQVPGDVVGIELVRQGNKWVYRFQVVAPDGRRSTLDVDADAHATSNGEDEDQ